MRYWWVNHKKTSKYEIAGGYLWSPRREARSRSQFYDNMRIAEPGDRVLSYSGGLVGYIGVVVGYAVPALKPLEFGITGEYWANDGWHLPVAWTALPDPVYPRTHISELGRLLPAKYSPIHPESGKGNQKAYLAEVSEPVFELLIGVNATSEDTAVRSDTTERSLLNVEDQVQELLTKDLDLSSTTRQQLVLARHGQGVFRERVAEMEKGCRLTAVSNPSLLVASHIKPWRVCGTAAERLDGANGLLLTPHVDRLFDRGLIGFESSGRVMVSPRMNPADLRRLGLKEASERRCGTFNSDQIKYLAYHRESVFLS